VFLYEFESTQFKTFLPSRTLDQASSVTYVTQCGLGGSDISLAIISMSSVDARHGECLWIAAAYQGRIQGGCSRGERPAQIIGFCVIIFETDCIFPTKFQFLSNICGHLKQFPGSATLNTVGI
jgi:hypothetical protein